MGTDEAASATTSGRYAPVTVANRIETLGAEIRKLERRITEHAYDAETGYRAATDDEKTRRAARLAPYIDEKRDQVAYWEGVRAAQIESGRASGYSRENVKKGDQVEIRGSWYEVVRANPKTVSVTTGYSWTRTAPYAEIEACKTPAVSD